MYRTRLTNSSKIAIDARVLAGKRAGKGRYLLGVLEGWLAQGFTEPVTLYGNLSGTDLPFTLPKNWSIVPAPGFTHGSMLIAAKMFQRGEDVLLSPAFYSASTFTTKPVVTIVYDLSVFRSPEARPSFRTIWGERVFIVPALWRSRSIVSISAFTKQELLDYFHLAETKVLTAPAAVDTHFQPRSVEQTPTEALELKNIAKTYQLPKEFVLFVGTLEPRKNLVRLLEGYGNLSPELQHRYPLILVGKRGWSTDQIDKILSRLESQGSVRRVDYVSDHDLPYFYNLATVVLYPSLYEGFGLPALEALASGTPLITANTTSLPEVVGLAALMVDPLDTRQITQELTKLLSDQKLQQRLRKLGPEQAKKYTWQAAAFVVHEALLQAADVPKRKNRVQ